MHVVKTHKGQRVYPIGSASGAYVLCLFPYKQVSRSGNLGVLQYVKTDNLIYTKEYGN